MKEPDVQASRRGFFGWLAAGLAATPFVGGLFVALRAAATPVHAERPERLALCRESDVPETGLLARGISYQMRRGPRVDQVAEIVFVTREPATGDILAMSSRCTHLGCPVALQPDAADAPLFCACHDAKFSATGTVIDGPPQRPLDRLPIERSDDGTIFLVLG